MPGEKVPNAEDVERDRAPARDRRLDLRYVGPIEGCYTLSDRGDLGDGVEVFACRTLSISSASIAVAAPVVGMTGDWLTAKFDGLGILRGVIERTTPEGFVFSIEATERQRLRLAARIDFLKKKAARQQSDRRAHKRRRPADPRSTLGLADGRVVNCFVLDYSRGGAAVSAPLLPAIGDRVMVGTLIGKVVRLLPVGFAIAFDAPQDIEGLDRRLTGYEVIGRPAAEPAAAAAA